MNPTSRFFAVISFIFATAVFSYFQKSSIDKVINSDNSELIVNKIPEVIYEDLDNATSFKVKDLLNKEKFVFVHFWGTWCAPCQEEFPQLVTLIEKLKDDPVSFVLVAANDDSKKVDKFLKRFKGLKEKSHVVLDNDGSSLVKFGTVKVPESYIFSPDGRGLKKFIGPQEWDQEYYFQKIRSIINPVSRL